MKKLTLWMSSVFLTFAVSFVKTQDCFPKGFKFGVATASYQVEGAWNESGKGESIWDHFTHTHPERIADHSTGDVADDSYHHTRDDLMMLGELNVQFYRFSISWPRVLPIGYSNNINKAGVRYYMDLIDALHKQGIEPVITMYHWDMPLNMRELGGWSNPVMADLFVDYARVVPWGFRKAFQWLKNSYNNPKVLVTENGVSTHPGLQDTKRIFYMASYMRAMLDAITKDHCNVIGYIHWSLMDNFEWKRGYT